MRWALAIIPIFEYGSLVRTSDFKWRLPWIGRAIMLHGWLESAATFQFVVDAMQEEWHVIAPDLRGCGGSIAPMSPISSCNRWPIWLLF